MPSPLAHAVFGASLWPVMKAANAPPRTWVWGAALAVLPDIDFVGFVMGVPYETIWGHRGITHSVFFAVLAASFAWWLFQRRHNVRPPLLWLYFVLAALSHGALDALTDGGLGVAFFAPFDATRYFFPFRPILVSPLSLEKVLTMRGVRILLNEIQWVGVPALILVLLGRVKQEIMQRSVPA
ncbi:MAG: metal-dependent hydrolase [Gemmatimonadaceae bacterium]